MNSRIHNASAGPALGALVLIASNLAPAHAAASHTEFSVTEIHVAWLAQPAPEITPSGHLKIEGWEHLWYDDADDDRLDGYDLVVIQGTFDSEGNLIYAHGTFTIREKLDDYEPEDFLSGDFDPEQIVMGAILFEGVFTLTPHQGVQGVTMSDEGWKAFYSFPDPFEFPVLHGAVRLLNPREN